MSLVPGVAMAQQSHRAHLTDRQVVEGVAFGEGPAADLIGEHADTGGVSARDVRAVHEVKRRLLDEVFRRDAKAVHLATTALRSGDPYQVRDGVRQLSSLLQRAVTRAYPHQAAKPSSQMLCGVICVCVAVVEIAVAGGVVVAVAAETAVAGHFVLWTKSKFWNSRTRPSVGPDAYVAKITRALAGTR